MVYCKTGRPEIANPLGIGGARGILEIIESTGRLGVDLVVAGADVDRRLADDADALGLHDHLRDVLVVRELVEGADGLPLDLLLLEDRAEGEAEGREGDGRDGGGAGDVAGDARRDRRPARGPAG